MVRADDRPQAPGVKILSANIKMMKTKIHYGAYLLLLIIPSVLSVLYVVSSNARGPYYLGSNSDPEYAYLLNSLRIVELRAPTHIDHPGTTMQIIGAGIIKGSNLGEAADVVASKVLGSPEKYLNLIGLFLFVLLVAVEIFAGLVAYALTKNMALALLFQSTPLLSIHPLQELGRARPDTLLIPVTLLFALIVLCAFYKPFDKANTHKYIFAFAILSGFAVATKITFTPLLIIPLLVIPSISAKLKYFFGTILFFVLFTAPIIRQYPAFFKWIFNLFSHNGKYGGGEKTVISPVAFSQNISSILSGEAIISTVLIMILSIASLVVFGWIKHRKIIYDKRFTLLLAIGLALILQLLMVSKHMSFHYLIPALMLMGVAIIVVMPLLVEHLKLNKIHLMLLVLIIPISVAANLRDFYVNIINMNEIQREHIKLSNFKVSLPKTFRIISYYGNSSQVYALAFGNNFSDRLFSPILRRMYPNEVFYSIWEREFSDFERAITADSVLQSQGNVFFQGISFKTPGYKGAYEPPFKLKDIYNGKRETVYQLERRGF